MRRCRPTPAACCARCAASKSQDPRPAHDRRMAGARQRLAAAVPRRQRGRAADRRRGDVQLDLRRHRAGQEARCSCSSTSSTTTSSASEFADRLIERAKAGVKIYLLYDDVGSFWPAARLQAAAARGRHQRPRLQPPPPLPALLRPDAHQVPQPPQDRRSSTARRPGSAGSMSATNTWAAASASGTGATPTCASRDRRCWRRR